MNTAPTIVTASRPIRSLVDVLATDVGAVGGKAGDLGELLDRGSRPPQGFVVTVEGAARGARR